MINYWKQTLSLVIILYPILFGCATDSPSASIEVILQEELTPFPNNWIEITPGIAASSLKVHGFKLYEEKRYDQALIIFDEIPVNEMDEGVPFFRANILLALDQYEAAQNAFQAIDANSPFYKESLWYQILLLLRQNQIKQAHTLIDNYQDLGFDFKKEEINNLQQLVKSLY